MSNNESKCGVVSDFNRELGFAIGDIVTVILHGDDNEYTGTVTNPKKLWVELSDYGQPFIADECSIKRVMKKNKPFIVLSDSKNKPLNYDDIDSEKKESLLKMGINIIYCSGDLKIHGQFVGKNKT